MTKSTAYEIHTLKEGNGIIFTVHDRKDDAMHEARRIYRSSKHVAGVKVLKEEFNSIENHSSTHVLYNEIRGQKRTKAKIKKVEEKKEIVRPKAVKKPEPKGSATNYFLMMILGVSAVLLAIVGIAYYYTTTANYHSLPFKN